jgi:hypothetical protein
MGGRDRRQISVDLEPGWTQVVAIGLRTEIAGMFVVGADGGRSA